MTKRNVLCRHICRILMLCLLLSNQTPKLKLTVGLGPNMAWTLNNKTVTTVSQCHHYNCSARDWDGKDYLRIIPRVVLVEDPRLT
jgi:hypothetical protein